jgi:hypothetical protein
MLLRYGAPVDDLNYYNLYEEEDPIAYGASPLMEAIMAKNGPTIEYLLSTRELQDGSCYDPAALCAAVDQNLIYIVDLMVSRRQEFKKFIESGFSAKSQSIISRWEGTALITAARQELPLFEDLLQDLSAMPLEAYSLMHFTAEYATTPMTDMSRMNFQFQITHHLDLISAAIRDRVTTPYIQRFIRRGAFVTIVSLKEAVPRSDMALLRLLLSHLSESEVSCKLDSTADSTGNLARTDENHSVNLSKVLSIAATMPDMTALNILLSHEHFLGTLEGSCGADHLASAGQLGHIENMASLLEKGANINACTTYMGFLDTVLETTAFFGRLDATKFVLDKNLTIEGEARRHYVNAVRMAQEQCHYAVANLIKSHGGWTRWDQDMLELFERTWSQMNVDGLYRRRFCCLEVDISEVAELGTTSHSASDGVLGQCHETEEPPTVVSNAADRDFDRWLSSLTSPQGVRAMETSLDSIAVVPTTPADVPGTPEEIRLGANEGLLDGEAGTIAECFFPDSFTMGEDSGDGSSVAGGSHGIWPAVVHEDEPILMASGGGISSTELDSCFVANEDIGDTLDLGLGLEWLGNEIDGTGSGLE